MRSLRSLCFLVMTGFSYSIIFFFLNINPANATTIPTFSPHITITGTVNTSFCLGVRFAGKTTAGCHDIHEAPDIGWQPETSEGKPPLLFESDEVDVCYSCHDGTSDTSDIKRQFGSDAGEKTSAHNIFIPKEEGGLLCSDCHSSHYAADNGDGTYEANEIIVLLRIKIGDVWKYLVDALNTAWIDEFGDKEKLSKPIEFCGGCHGSPTSAYGDHVTYFSDSVHNNSDFPNPPTSGTVNSGIKCNVCHNQHGSSNYKLISEKINGVTVSANDNQVCYVCHTSAPGGGAAYFGKTLYEKTKHSTVTDSGSASALVSITDSYEAGFCMNCHNPHGTSYNDFRRDKNDLCFNCHDDVTVNLPANYSYRGDNKYNTSAHADSAKWPSSGYTGDVIGGGGGATEGECINCHAPMGRDDGSGDPVANLLLTWSYSTNSNEEYLCFGENPGLGECHANGYDYNQQVDTFYGMTDSIDIYNNFTAGSYTATSTSGAEVNTSHDIFKADQDISGAKVECSDCHNTHINNKDYDFNGGRSRIADPDDPTQNFTQAYDKDAQFANGEFFSSGGSDLTSSFDREIPNFVNFCLKCHDGEAPSGVIGATKAFNISTSYSAGSGADAHGRGGSSNADLKNPYATGGFTGAYSAMNCNDCHDSHGTSNLYNLKNPIYINGQYMAPSVSAVVSSSYYGSTGGWCTTCHESLPAGAAHDGSQDCGDCHSHGSNF